MAELVDARDLKSLDGNVVWVRVPPPAPKVGRSNVAFYATKRGGPFEGREMKRPSQIELPHKTPRPRAALRVAVAGLGAIGLFVAEALDRGILGCVLTAASANDCGKAAERLHIWVATSRS